jgi:hypothetical protein
MNATVSRWIRRTSPALAGVALVLMLHGDFVLSVVFAILFFFAYVGSDWRFLIGHRPAPKAPVRDSGPGEGVRGNREVPPAPPPGADDEEHRDA